MRSLRSLAVWLWDWVTGRSVPVEPVWCRECEEDRDMLVPHEECEDHREKIVSG